MYDPKFEKGVRQKMEGLEFIPSESVWPNIQKAVADQHRRHAGFYFWRFALPGMLLAGIVSALYYSAKPVPTQTTTRSTAPVSPAPVTAASTSPAAPAATLATTATAPSGASSASVTPASAATSPIPAGDAALSPSRGTNAAVPAMNKFAEVSAKDKFAGVSAKDKIARGSKDKVAAVSVKDNIAVRSAKDATLTKGSDAARVVERNPAAGQSASPSGTIAPYLYQPQLAGLRNTAAVREANLPAKTSLIGLSALQKTKRPWEAGFMAGAGISRLNRLNLSTAAQDQALSANLYAIASPAAAASSKKYVSDVRPDASFMGGVYLQKPLSSRWILNLGMNLHYYSTRITIGEPVNTYVPVSVSLIAPTVAASAQNSTAYIAGDREVFTNHYYFLELPVNMQYKLNKSRLLPLFVEGGVSLARLMGSDALFYNTHSGVYYKDPSVLQKTQFNISSALLIGVPFHGIRIEGGPQVQYGVTPLVNDHNQGDQHFLYTGIKVVVIPGRK